jgi:coenzyme PQQ biosynthesis protein B
MEIIILGTASNGGTPQVDCMRCRACKAAMTGTGHNKRTNSSILVKNGNNFTLIDATPDLRQQLIRERISTEKVSEIFITHAHGDHMMGLFETSVGHVMQIPVYSAKEILNKIFGEEKTFSYLSDQGWVIPRELALEKEKIIGELAVTPFEVPHTPLELGPTLGFKILQDEKTLIYIPDFAMFTKKILSFIDGADVLIIDGCFYQHVHPAHISISASLPILQQLRIGQVYYTSINHSEGLHDELEKLAQPFHIGYDGLKIRL